MKLIKKVLLKIKSVLLNNYYHEFDNIKSRNNYYFLNDSNFLKSYNESNIQTDFSVPYIPLRVHQAIWCSLLSKTIEGNIIELGTGKGFIFLNILNFIGDDLKEKNIYLCDTFLPYKPDPDDGIQKSSGVVSKIYSDSKKDVEKTFSKWKNVKIIEGYLPNSLNHIIDSKLKISFLHVDLNHHIPEIKCLNKLWNNIQKGGIILLDDFGNPGRKVQMEKHIEFFKSKKQNILSLACGQGLVIKT